MHNGYTYMGLGRGFGGMEIGFAKSDTTWPILVNRVRHQ
jgi:hypothetical protein